MGQSGGIPGLDLNVEAAWARGFTGKGITTAIMDDGKHTHLNTIDFYVRLFEQYIVLIDIRTPI